MVCGGSLRAAPRGVPFASCLQKAASQPAYLHPHIIQNNRLWSVDAGKLGVYSSSHRAHWRCPAVVTGPTLHSPFYLAKFFCHLSVYLYKKKLTLGRLHCETWTKDSSATLDATPSLIRASMCFLCCSIKCTRGGSRVGPHARTHARRVMRHYAVEEFT